jgi:hypothetical protein
VTSTRRTNEIPESVLSCVLFDGAKALDRIGDDPGNASDLDDIGSFRSIWHTRGFVDIPIWQTMGTISPTTANLWQQHARELLAFIDRNASLGVTLFVFEKAKLGFLFCAANDEAFQIGFPPKCE